MGCKVPHWVEYKTTGLVFESNITSKSKPIGLLELIQLKRLARFY